MSLFFRTIYARLSDPHSSPPGRGRVAQRLEEALRQASAQLGLDRVRVGLPSDAAAEKSWDLVLVLDFVDAASCARESQPGSALEACLARELLPMAVVVKAWSFVEGV